jgi:hypothetical protein
MARLRREIAAEREQFMTDLFKQDPNLSIAKANERLKEKYGANMRLQKAYELRKRAQAASVATTVEQQADVVQQVARGRKPGKRVPVPTTVQAQVVDETKPVVIPANPSMTEAIATLNALGLTHLGSETVMGGKYMVIVPIIVPG